ncbi:MAG: DNA-processing protein DprA [Patescibacteria group bacterium]|nr:DNA-processing protein DprA [Patescibacteria group bacterium]
MEEIYFHAITTNFEPPNKKVISLYKKYKSFRKIFEILEKEFRLKKDWVKEYQELQKNNIHIIIRKNLPSNLKAVREPILGLYYYGNLYSDEKLTIAIVGTRKPSELGKKISYQFSQELSKIGITIVSGLAYGIDQQAHEGALSLGKRNIAVIGCGLKTILRDSRAKLIEKIINNNGLVISEYFPEAGSQPHHFPLRNRIIAGLSDGILIIEAPIDSGALITARYGLLFNKEIFVIPSDIYNKNYLGSLRLIQEGANLVIEPEDILRHFDFKIPQKIRNLSLSSKENEIIKSIEVGNLTISEISQSTNLPINEVLSLISHLEIKGLVFEENGKFYLSQ